MTNGHSKYTTRAATGTIKPRRYCADGSFTDKNEEMVDSSLISEPNELVSSVK